MIYIFSTYPPKACGIAVFTQNFVQSLNKNILAKKNKKIKKPSEEVKVMAILDEEENDDRYAQEVIYKIKKNEQKEYLQAADFVNINKPQVCIIEHEFGIFGGREGFFILPFLNRVKIKTVVVFHTILQNPDSQQRLIIRELAKRADRVVVMSEFGITYLKKIYGVHPDKISFIPHGVPYFKSTLSHSLDEKRKNFPGQLLVTFGLLSRNKGLETAILAMKEIIKSFPDARYLIVGKTHPEVVKRSGEEYRHYLNRLVEENKLQKHVLFINSFLSEDQIIDYVRIADLYVTPYQDPNQITSGTLSYAIGSGTPFISTPYRYAEEKAQIGCGRLFPFHGSNEMASVVKEIFKNPNELKKMRKKCQEVRKAMSWENVAGEYLKLFSSLKAKPELSDKHLEVTEEYQTSFSWMPTLNMSHVYRLTDSTGIIQHAHFNIPRFRDGYCVDDNARALLLMCLAYRIKKNSQYEEKISTYLSFIDYMLNEDGSIRNFLSFDRRYLDEIGSDDAYGRTLWSLGYLVAFPPTGHFQEIAETLFSLMRKNLPRFAKKGSLRGIANAVMGLTYFLEVYNNDEEIRELLQFLAHRISDAYHNNQHQDWNWFEEKMTYDNALLPLALIRSYKFLKNQDFFEVGIKTFHFLEKAMLVNGYYCPIGNEQWYHSEHQTPSKFDQQPIEIMTLTWLNYHSFRITKKVTYLKKIQNAFRWFLGNNSLGISLYDYETKGCGDGLQNGTINRNQGAESTLSFWISYCLVFLAMEMEPEQ